MPTRVAPDPALPSAVRAFDLTADRFDERFGEWRSVAAQRAAVRCYLLRIFPPGSRLLELGAGTGEDALFMLERGYDVTLTDGSPRMVERASEKLRRAGYGGRARVEQAVLESLDDFAERARASGRTPYDGAYSNFAAFNCIEDLRRVALPLAKLLRPGAACALVVFGPCSIGEIVVQLIRRDPKAAFRRFRRGPAPARLGGEHFQVWYPRPRDFARAFSPYFRLRRVRGIGILVPPSAAEPWISEFPRVVKAFEAVDRVLTAPLARLGDHVLLHLERTEEEAR
ncbi:MAG TPA: class I SAM-dependent methyltransferase [Longimicrobiales bacterium]